MTFGGAWPAANAPNMAFPNARRFISMSISTVIPRRLEHGFHIRVRRGGIHVNATDPHVRAAPASTQQLLRFAVDGVFRMLQQVYRAHPQVQERIGVEAAASGDVRAGP